MTTRTYRDMFLGFLALVACMAALVAVFGAGIIFGGCVPPMSMPRPVRASVVWERGPCVVPPEHEECVDGYTVTRCDDAACWCEMHVVWTGYIEDSAAWHEWHHCMLNAAGTPDPYHEGAGWARRIDEIGAAWTRDTRAGL